MNRVYTDTSDFRAPYDAAVLSGLGSCCGGLRGNQWPKGRRYYDVSNFRAPYDTGYFQEGGLLGVELSAAEQQQILSQPLPTPLRRYLSSGAPMRTWLRDLGTSTAQVPQWAWLLMAAGAGAISYAAYKRHEKAKKGAQK